MGEGIIKYEGRQCQSRWAQSHGDNSRSKGELQLADCMVASNGHIITVHHSNHLVMNQRFQQLRVGSRTHRRVSSDVGFLPAS